MIGERLRMLRKANNMTQEQVAAHLNAAKSTVSQYENDVNEPDLKTVIRLADLYGVSVDRLLGREELPSGTSDGAGYPNLLLRERLTEEEADYLGESLMMYRKWKARRARDRRDHT